MPFAARIGDPTNHPGLIGGPGVPLVLIGGQPAAVQGTPHACAMPPLAGPHPPSAIVKGSLTVLIGNLPAARVGDLCGCGAVIAMGAPLVEIGG
jgi:uncharacterized Zn-binding protein involved in type VI secretion